MLLLHQIHREGTRKLLVIEILVIFRLRF